MLNESYKQKNRGAEMALKRRLSISFVPFIAGIFLLSVIGCDSVVDPPPPPPPPPATQLEFIMQVSSANYHVYVDGILEDSLSSNGQLAKVEVTAGGHTFYIKDIGCTNKTSAESSINVLEGETKRITLTTSYPGFSLSSPNLLTATDGTYSSSVRLSWGDLNSPDAPNYEVYRATGSGSFVHVATVTSKSYVDYNVSAITVYTYKVRAKWPCSTSGWSNTNSGFKKSARFSNTRVRIDDFNKRIYMHTEIQIDGYRNYSLRLAGYWFRKSGSTYYYVPSNCISGVPGGWIGAIWSSATVPCCDRTTISNAWFWVGYDCFKDKTGEYHGKFKLYSNSSVGHVNDPTIAESVYLGITWSSRAPGEEPDIRIRQLSVEEIQNLENAASIARVEQIPSNVKLVAEYERLSGSIEASLTTQSGINIEK